jgi:hypothetical protein
MQRMKPGPFGGCFDELMFDSPAFVPVLATCALLAFVWIAAVWALWRHRYRPRGQRVGNRFPVTPAPCMRRDT